MRNTSSLICNSLPVLAQDSNDYRQTLAQSFESPLSHFRNYTLSDFGRVSGIAISPDGNLVASAHVYSWMYENHLDSNTYNGGINLWDAKTMRHLGVLGGHPSVMALSWTPDSKQIISVTEGEGLGSVRVWDVISKTELKRFGENRSFHTVKVLPNGLRFLLGSSLSL